MNRFPADVDTNILVGHVLEMICFNANQVYFHFDGRISITAETTFVYERSSTAGTGTEIVVPVMQSNLMQLLEHRVSETRLEEQHILTMIFDNGHSLRFFDTAPGRYESYRLTIGSKTIIV